jgi:hypothetical protein
MEYPDPKIRRYQAKFLADCPPGEQAFHAALFRTAKAAYRYHQQASQIIEPTREDFDSWLHGLPAPIQQAMETDGFEKCRKYLPFTRHVMEPRDIGMDTWMKNQLSEEVFQYWKNNDNS